jgi:hypothetical protein
MDQVSEKSPKLVTLVTKNSYGQQLKVQSQWNTQTNIATQLQPTYQSLQTDSWQSLYHNYICIYKGIISKWNA